MIFDSSSRICARSRFSRNFHFIEGSESPFLWLHVTKLFLQSMEHVRVKFGDDQIGTYSTTDVAGF